MKIDCSTDNNDSLADHSSTEVEKQGDNSEGDDSVQEEMTNLTVRRSQGETKRPKGLILW